MKQFLFGFITALLLLAVLGLGYIALGLAPVATASGPLPFEKLITGIALNARVNREAPKSSPIPVSDEAYAALLNGQGVTNDPVGVTYWKVANGIRLTGMPGFNGSLSTDQMWQVSLLLANANKLPATVVSALKEPLVLQ